MRLVDELHPMKLYSAKNKIYIPFNVVNKKKGATIQLLTKDLKASSELMNLPYLYNPGLYKSYFMSRNVMVYINANGSIADEVEDEEDTNPGQSLAEAVFHKNQFKKVFIDTHGSPNDYRLLSEYFSDKTFKKAYAFFGKSSDFNWPAVTVYGFNSVAQMAKAVNGQSILQNGEMVIYSYSSKDEIFVLNRSAFNEIEKQELDYEMYCKNALITHICMNTSRNCSRELANQVGSALSGQAKAIRDRAVEKNEDIKDDIQWALAINALYEAEGKSGIRELVRTGNPGLLVKYIKAGTLNAIKKLIKHQNPNKKNIIESAIYNELSSKLDNEFKKKTHMSLNTDFIAKPLDISNQYPEYNKLLELIRFVESSNGEIFIDKKTNQPAAFYMTETKDDEVVWISALEIMKEYQGHGLSKQLLMRADVRFNATDLSVNKKNEVAIKVYENYGFRTYGETEYMYFMTLRKNINESTGLDLILELATIGDEKIAVGTDFHFIGYDENLTKIIMKPASYIEKIITKENEIVGDNGVFIFLGDLFYKSFRTEYDIPDEMKDKAIAYAKLFSGKYKILVRGNHDKLPDEFYLNCGFTHICSSLRYGNILFTHQPEIVVEPMINIHGHIHGLRTYVEGKPKNYMDVYTVNASHIDSLPKILSKSEKYQETIKQASDINRADPHHYIPGDNLNLEDIIDESALLETILLNKDDIEYKVDDWKNGDINILYITGLSGSGKSTSAKKLAKDFNAEVFELDRIEHYKDYMDRDPYSLCEKVLKKYFTKTKESRDTNEMDDAEYNKFFMDAYNELYRYAISKRNTKFIFEGVQIVSQLHTRIPHLLEGAIIIKGTSAASSLSNRTRRDKELILGNKKRSIPYMAKWYLNAEKYMNMFRREILKHTVNESALLESYKNKSSDVHAVIDSLDKEELDHIGGGYWVDSDHVIYRKMEYQTNKPVGFIDVYLLPKFKRTGLVVLATTKDARGKGIGKKLANSAIQYFKSNHKDIDKLRWLVDKDNPVSINMAKSLGFKLSNETKEEYEYIYSFNESALLESDGSHMDCIRVYNAMDSKDKHYLSGGYDYIHMPNKDVIYRHVIRDGILKIKGFVEVTYDGACFQATGHTGSVIIGVHPLYRGEGIAKELVQTMFKELPKEQPTLSNLIWRVDPDNKASIKLAEKSGFKLVRKTSVQNMYRYEFKENKDYTYLDDKVINEDDLIKWLKKNFTITDDRVNRESKIRSVKDLMKSKKGTSFDCACLASAYLQRMGILNLIVFFIGVDKDYICDVKAFNIFSYNNKTWFALDGASAFVNGISRGYNSPDLICDEYVRRWQYKELPDDYNDGSKLLSSRYLPIHMPKEGSLIIGDFIDPAKVVDESYTDDFSTVIKESSITTLNDKVKRNIEQIPLPKVIVTEGYRKTLEEDGYVLGDDYLRTQYNNCNAIYFFGEDTVLQEANKTYDSRLKRYLYKERLRTNKSLISIYDKVKEMNPWITKTYLKIGLYNKLNLFIDLSYYNGLFLKNNTFIKANGVKMYWDFLERLLKMNDPAIKSLYQKNTIFIPVYNGAWDIKPKTHVYDWKQNINPISIIFYMAKYNSDELKRKWGDKNILLLSPNGFIKIDFNDFEYKNLPRLKLYIDKLMSGEAIEDDEEEDGYKHDESDSAGAITAKITDKIEKNAGIKLDDISLAVKSPESLAIKSIGSIEQLRIRSYKIPIEKSDDRKDTCIGIAVASTSTQNFVKSINSLDNIKIDDYISKVYIPS